MRPRRRCSCDRQRVPRRRARVGGLCGFPDTAERVPAKHQKTGRCTDVRECPAELQHRSRSACGRFSAEGEAASGEAGESQGVVCAPWQTHLPAVRAVWGFRTGVVERAKTALLGSEAQIVPLFQGKQRGCAQNWRKIGMANKKIKFPLWLMPDTKATVECLYRQDGCNSQSEFIEKAILFYCGYLQSEYAGDFLPKILGETLEAILSMFGDRIGKLLLKQAVEQNVCNHILASDTDIDAQTYQQMRGKSYQEVLRTNGQISFPEVLRQKSRW